MKHELMAKLAGSAMFRGCSAEQLARLAAEASVHHERRGFVIAQRGFAFPFLGFVCSGVVGVTALAAGRVRRLNSRVLLYRAFAGSTFGAISVVDRSAALGEVEVLSKRATYALIPGDVIAGLMQGDVRLSQRLSRVVAMRCRELTMRLEMQHGWTVKARVARALLPFASSHSGMQLARPELAEIRQSDIAAAVGCVTAAAARAIAELERERALRRQGGHIRFADRERLLAVSRETREPKN